MRAAYVARYGPPEHVSIVELPVPEPGPGEVLVRVEACAVTAGDARMRAGRFPRGFGLPARLAIGLRGPRRHVLGVVLSGTVERVGPGAARFAAGDSVAGMTGARCGAHAEYAVLRESALAALPDGVSHEGAAGVLFGGTTALHFLRERAGVAPGMSVLVNGASGAVGTSAVQLAAHFGAEVTAVTSAPNRELVSRLGAARTVDYRETPVERIGDRLGERFDIVFDAVGNVSRAEGLRLAKPEGSVILAVAGLAETITARGRVLAGSSPERAEDFALLLGLLAEGRLDPVTEVLGGLDAVPEAHRRIDTGRKVGNLVVLPPLAD